MKIIILLFLIFSISSFSQSDSLIDNKKWKGEHQIFAEGFGVGLLGSVGYGYSLFNSKNISFNSDIGVGGTFRIKEKYRYVNAYVLSVNLSFDLKVYNSMYLSFGLSIAEYMNVYKLKNIEKTEANLIPKINLYYAPNFGVGIKKNRFNLILCGYKFFNFFSYNGFFPSLKLKYRL